METTRSLQEELTWLLDQTIDRKASDLHLQALCPPMVRIDGQLRSLDMPPMSVDRSHDLIRSLIGSGLEEKIRTTRKELDFSFGHREHRFRVNVYYAKGTLSASFRLLVNDVGGMKELGIAPALSKMIEQSQGLIIVAGPTGHGKSTTLAAMINHVSDLRRAHIITIEDPIEYIFEQRQSMISQREIGIDTPSFGSALRSALREDPDIVVVGEMRDLETVEAALQMAETGHLVITTLHTNSAAQTAERIIGLFPDNRQNQIRQQLANTLLGIVSQRLLPRLQGGRQLVSEVLMATSPVRAILREGKTYQLPNVIQTSASDGMISMEKALADLVNKGEVAVDEALAWAVDPKTLKTMIYQ